MTRFLVLGLPVNVSDNYLGCVKDRLQSGDGTHIVTINSEMAMQAQDNLELASVICQAELVIPDGSGVVLFMRSQGIKINRCPGIELAELVVELAAQEGLSIFLIGGAVGVTKTVVAKWQSKYGNKIAIAGEWDGFFDAHQAQQLLAELELKQPQIILVGLGVPRQEFWIRDHRHLCPTALWIGVGGSFDIWSGLKNRAPKWLRNNHLEWVYRLYKEPWRAKRMLALPQFVFAVIWQVMRQTIKKVLRKGNARNSA
jgi:N-acetylglucosaminyldiphosphoundecaprenol N-acetyl-beta-D-mannosaminyltransferase